MNRSIPALAILALTAPFVLAVTPSPTHQSTATSEALLTEITELREKYRDSLMPYDSPDRALFKRVWQEARTSDALIHELIDLTSIQTRHPVTAARFTAYSLSPASNLLFSLGDLAKPHIEARLAGDELTVLQREILSEILIRWEQRAETKRIDAAFYEALRAEEALQAGKEAAQSAAALKASNADNSEVANPNRNLVWALFIAAGALAVVWFGIRSRGWIRRTVGTAADA